MIVILGRLEGLVMRGDGGVGAGREREVESGCITD